MKSRYNPKAKEIPGKILKYIPPERPADEKEILARTYLNAVSFFVIVLGLVLVLRGIPFVMSAFHI